MDTVPLSAIGHHHPHLRLAIVFGSVAAGTARLDSDIDLAVLGKTPLTTQQRVALITDLARATGRSVDLIDLREAGEPLLGEILRHGRKLFGSNEDLTALMQRHVYATEDFVPGIQRMLEQRNRQWLHS